MGDLVGTEKCGGLVEPVRKEGHSYDWPQAAVLPIGPPIGPQPFSWGLAFLLPSRGLSTASLLSKVSWATDTSCPMCQCLPIAITVFHSSLPLPPTLCTPCSRSNFAASLGSAKKQKQGKEKKTVTENWCSVF